MTPYRPQTIQPTASDDSIARRHRAGNRSLCLVAPIVAALALRLGATLLLGGAQLWGDEPDYNALAASLCSGRGIARADGTPTAARPPGYVLFVSAVYGAAGRIPIAVKLAQAALDTVTVLVVGLCAACAAGASARPLAMWIYALHPLCIYSVTLLYPQSLASLLMACGLWCVLRWVGEDAERARGVRGSASWLLAAAAVASLAGQTVTALYAVVPCLALLVLARACVRWPGRLGLASALLAVCVLSALPWALRNRAALGRPVPFSTQGGLNLYKGTVALSATGFGDNPTVSAFAGTTLARLGYLSEVEQDRALSKLALGFCCSHPVDAAHGYAIKLGRLFEFVPHLVSGTPSLAADRVWPLLAAFELPLYAAALAGVYSLLRRGRPVAASALASFLVAPALAYALAITVMRYRVPLVPALAALASLPCARALQTLRRLGPRGQPATRA